MLPLALASFIVAGATLILPVFLYPFSRVIWLAVDVAIRPRSEKEG